MADDGPLPPRSPPAIVSESEPFPAHAILIRPDREGAGGNILLRHATDRDDAILRQLHHAERRDEAHRLCATPAMADAFLDDQFAWRRDHVRRAHPDADQLLLCPADAPDEAIGTLQIDRTSPRWRLIDLLVGAEHRGNGLGRALILWLQDAALAADATGIELCVLHDNRRAQALYRACGFVDDARQDALYRHMIWHSADARNEPP